MTRNRTTTFEVLEDLADELSDVDPKNPLADEARTFVERERRLDPTDWEEFSDLMNETEKIYADRFQTWFQHRPRQQKDLGVVMELYPPGIGKDLFDDLGKLITGLEKLEDLIGRPLPPLVGDPIGLLVRDIIQIQLLGEGYFACTREHAHEIRDLATELDEFEEQIGRPLPPLVRKHLRQLVERYEDFVDQ